MSKRVWVGFLAVVAVLALTVAPVAAQVQSQKASGQSKAEEKKQSNKGKSQSKEDGSKKSGGSASTQGSSKSSEAKSQGATKSSEAKSQGKAGAQGHGKNKGPYTSGSPGNNGTVKIDGREFDDHRRNEPHPGCDFRVQFFGFDEGPDLHADVRFEGHAPTGGGTLLTDRVFIGGGYTVTRVYNLSAALAGVEPHPKQGYHVKLYVNAEYSQGADTKHKVFWVQCGQPTSVGAGEIEQPDGVKDETVCPEDNTMVDGVCVKTDEVRADETVCPEGATMVDGVCVNDTVLGTQLQQDEVAAADVVAPAAQRRGLGAVLPFTGASLVMFLLAALGLLAGGFALLRARRS